MNLEELKELNLNIEKETAVKVLVEKVKHEWNNNSNTEYVRELAMGTIFIIECSLGATRKDKWLKKISNIMKGLSK